MRNRSPLSIALILAALSAGPETDVLGQDEAALTANQLSPAEVAAGWSLLFDGETTDGWRGYRQESFPGNGWVVEDGCLRVVAGGRGGDLITVGQYEHFEPALEFRVSPGANSGIMYRVTEDYRAPWHSGPEYQILDDAGYGVGPTDSHASGGLYDLYDTTETKILKPVGEFNAARIRIDHNRLEHWINGVKVVDCVIGSDDWTERVVASKFNVYRGFGRSARGHICIQDHGHDVWFRNIRVRDLARPMPGELALMNARDLSGWTPYLSEEADANAVFSVADGVLTIAGRPAGYLRTDQTYQDFVLMLDWRWNPVTKQAGNSGVLLRVIGEDKVWPRSLEAQLMNDHAGDFWNIDDFGMQADPDRMRGRNTRKLHAAEHDVGQWNTYEIHVDGGDVTLWINGVLVNRAWDVREEPGWIALQSEGTEIQFRNIRLAPIR